MRPIIIHFSSSPLADGKSDDASVLRDIRVYILREMSDLEASCWRRLAHFEAGDYHTSDPFSLLDILATT